MDSRDTSSIDDGDTTLDNRTFWGSLSGITKSNKFVIFMYVTAGLMILCAIMGQFHKKCLRHRIKESKYLCLYNLMPNDDTKPIVLVYLAFGYIDYLTDLAWVFEVCAELGFYDVWAILAQLSVIIPYIINLLFAYLWLRILKENKHLETQDASRIKMLQKAFIMIVALTGNGEAVLQLFTSQICNLKIFSMNLRNKILENTTKKSKIFLNCCFERLPQLILQIAYIQSHSTIYGEYTTLAIVFSTVGVFMTILLLFSVCCFDDPYLNERIELTFYFASIARMNQNQNQNQNQLFAQIGSSSNINVSSINNNLANALNLNVVSSSINNNQNNNDNNNNNNNEDTGSNEVQMAVAAKIDSDKADNNSNNNKNNSNNDDLVNDVNSPVSPRRYSTYSDINNSIDYSNRNSFVACNNNFYNKSTMLVNHQSTLSNGTTVTNMTNMTNATMSNTALSHGREYNKILEQTFGLRQWITKRCVAPTLDYDENSLTCQFVKINNNKNCVKMVFEIIGNNDLKNEKLTYNYLNYQLLACPLLESEINKLLFKNTEYENEYGTASSDIIVHDISADIITTTEDGCQRASEEYNNDNNSNHNSSNCTNTCTSNNNDSSSKCKHGNRPSNTSLTIGSGSGHGVPCLNDTITNTLTPSTGGGRSRPPSQLSPLSSNGQLQGAGNSQSNIDCKKAETKSTSHNGTIDNNNNNNNNSNAQLNGKESGCISDNRDGEEAQIGGLSKEKKNSKNNNSVNCNKNATDESIKVLPKQENINTNKNHNDDDDDDGITEILEMSEHGDDNNNNDKNESENEKYCKSTGLQSESFNVKLTELQETPSSVSHETSYNTIIHQNNNNKQAMVNVSNIRHVYAQTAVSTPVGGIGSQIFDWNVGDCTRPASISMTQFTPQYSQTSTSRCSVIHHHRRAYAYSLGSLKSITDAKHKLKNQHKNKGKKNDKRKQCGHGKPGAGAAEHTIDMPESCFGNGISGLLE